MKLKSLKLLISISFLITVLFILPSKVFATAYVSVGSGNWNNSATWTPTGIPGDGDTVKIANGHTVTIPLGYQAIIGVSGAGGTALSGGGPTPAVACTTDNGTGILIINGTLTFRGNVEQCNATWQANAGAILEHDSTLSSAPATTHYRWMIGMQFRPTAVLNIRGVKGNRVTVRNATGTTTGTFYGFTWYGGGSSAQNSGLIDFEYVNIDGCGGSTPCAEGASWTGATTFRCDHCSVTNSGYFRWSEQAINISTTFKITNSSFTSSADSSHYVILVGGGGGSTDLILLDTIYTDGVIYFNGSPGFGSNFHVRNIFIRDINNTKATDNNPGFRVAEFDRVLRITDVQGTGSTGSFAYIPSGDFTRLMCLMNSATNPHCFSGPNSLVGYTDSIDGAYMEETGPNTDGDSILGNGSASTLTTIKNVVMACNPTTGYSMSLSSTALPTNRSFSLQNNTYCGKDDGSDSRGFGFEVPGTAAVGMLASAINNIVFCNTNIACYLVHKGPTGTAQAGTYQNVDYNWKWNVAVGPYFDTAGGTYLPDPPGAHDLSGDPKYVEQRHFLDWGKHLDPSITSWTDIVNKFAKMNDDTGYDPRFNIADAYNWLRDGYRPRNPALMTAGSVGDRVGAMDLNASFSANGTSYKWQPGTLTNQGQ